MKRFRKFLKNQKGQGMLEYVLLLVIIVGLVMAFKGKISDIFYKATGNLDSATQDVFQPGH